MRRLIGAAVLLLAAFVVSLWLPEPGETLGAVAAGSASSTAAAPTMGGAQLAGDPGPASRPQQLAAPAPRSADEGVTAPQLDAPELYIGDDEGQAAPGTSADAVEEGTPPEYSGQQEAAPAVKAETPSSQPRPLPPAPLAAPSASTPAAPKPATTTPSRSPAAASPTAPSTKSASPAPAKSESKAATTSAGGKWFVQAGSYSDIANARSVESRIKGLGLAAFIGVIDSSKGTFYRVRSGPYPSREKAEAARAKLQQAQLSATVVQDG